MEDKRLSLGDVFDIFVLRQFLDVIFFGAFCFLIISRSIFENPFFLFFVLSPFLFQIFFPNGPGTRVRARAALCARARLVAGVAAAETVLARGA